jgi:3-hydroxyisobutyrate dehydrogenase
MALRVAFIGLGVMGYPMAGHLARAGHDVVVYNRTAAKAASWVEQYGGRSAPTPAAAAARRRNRASPASAATRCARRSRWAAHGAFGAMAQGGLRRSHDGLGRHRARIGGQAAHQRGFGFVDAPVSGGEQGAKNGQLTIMCGGSDADYAKAEPVMAAYARQCRLMGERAPASSPRWSTRFASQASSGPFRRLELCARRRPRSARPSSM